MVGWPQDRPGDYNPLGRNAPHHQGSFSQVARRCCETKRIPTVVFSFLLSSYLHVFLFFRRRKGKYGRELYLRTWYATWLVIDSPWYWRWFWTPKSQDRWRRRRRGCLRRSLNKMTTPESKNEKKKKFYSIYRRRDEKEEKKKSHHLLLAGLFSMMEYNWSFFFNRARVCVCVMRV